MKKVAVFINSMRGGGAERIISYLLNKGQDKYEFHLILLEDVIEYPIPKDKIHIYIIEKKVTSGFMNMVRLRLLARKLHHYLEEQGIDTLLSLLNRPNIISCQVKKRGWKGRLIISERVDTVAYYKTLKLGFIMLWLVKRFYPYADQVTVISRGIADSLSGLGVKNARVIYNPVQVLTEIKGKDKADKPFTFINIARFEEQKNHRLLLEAFARMKYKDCMLELLGKGSLKTAMEDLAGKLGIKDRVRFLGFHQHVNPYLQNADCFVFSSDFEGLGNVIIEAMNNGVPVISTDCPHGPREILDPASIGKGSEGEIDFGRYGILVPVKNSKLLAEAMEKIYEDEELRNKYAQSSRERVKDFDLEHIAGEYFSLF